VTESHWLLVHSPLVGPSAWRPLQEAAGARGIRTLLPDLTGVVEAPRPQWTYLVDASVAAVDVTVDEIVVVGHSGAGAVLPLIGRRLGRRLRGLVFVDAVLPPISGSHRTANGLLALVDDLAVEGRLPAWLDWWPDETVDELVPDPADRRTLRSDMPLLDRSFYDDPVPVPANWATGPCAYVRLSAAYDTEYDSAVDLGWPTSSLEGTHLSVFTEPDRVLDELVDLTAS
jgi:pimeloyl-ACP methyl ester carboxylesterase